MRIGRLTTTTMIQLLLIVNTIMVLYPLLVMGMSAFKSTPELFRNPFGLPESFSFANFVQVWERTNFPLYFRNSLVVTSGAVVLILVLG